jgi:hypothetical protein
MPMKIPNVTKITEVRIHSEMLLLLQDYQEGLPVSTHI